MVLKSVLVGGAGVLATGGVGALLKLFKVDLNVIVWLLVAVAVAAALYFGVKALLALKDKAKALPFKKLIQGAAGRNPVGVADPAKLADLQKLRDKFSEGVEKFANAGKDLYSLPWYLLVGPAGSGKTEMIRHCKVGFPPGLHDPFQGTGGTLNMHWWFTNYAVVLDTAGRMFMDESALAGNSEWRELLKLLKSSRSNAPINGMLLVIGIDSLIKDTSEQIEAKAGHIAKQLDTIQRTLDVRFPVYVVVTKCDLITGFREFFDKMDDPQLQHQMLGWSNPAALDEPFKAETVDQHIKAVRDRLLKRRATLLLDPVHTDDPQDRRTDQVDELFALPDNLAKIAPRLRRYLEIIFQVGEWSPKPLFLRGIYLTSSMRQGQALDEDLAAAMGLPVDQLPGGKVWDEERSFFLRDVFVSKVFREKGLVTRATNVDKEQRARRRLILTSGIAAVLGLLGLTVLSNARLRATVKDRAELWADVLASVEKKTVAVVEPEQKVEAGERRVVFAYAGSKDADSASGSKRTRLGILTDAADMRERTISAGLFAPAAMIGDITGNQDKAYRVLVRRGVLEPVVGGVRDKLATLRQWDDPAVAALGTLVRLETAAAGLAPAAQTKDAPPPAATDVRALLAFLLGDLKAGSEEAQAAEKLQAQVQAIYDGGGLSKETLAELGVGTESSAKQLAGLIAKMRDDLTRRASEGDSPLGKLAQLAGAVKAFGASRDELLALIPAEAPASVEEYNAIAGKWRAAVGALESAAKALDAPAADYDPTKPVIAETLAGGVRDEMKKTVFDGLVGSLPAKPEGGKTEPANLSAVRAALDQAWEEFGKQIQTKAMEAASALADAQTRALLAAGRPNEKGYRSVLGLYQIVTEMMADAPLPGQAPGVEWLSVRPAVDAIDEAKKKADAAIKQWRSSAQATVPAARIESAEQAVALARAGRVGGVIKSFVTPLAEQYNTSDKLGELASGQAAPGEKDPIIAMTGFVGNIRDSSAAKFHQPTAGQLFRAWDVASKEADKAVEGKDSAAKMSALKPAVRTYAQAYKAHWLKEVEDDGAVRRFNSWADFVVAYRKDAPNPVTVHSQFAEMLKRVVDDLAPAVALIDDPGAKRDLDRLTELLGKYTSSRGADDPGVKEAESVQRCIDELVTKDNAEQARLHLLDKIADRPWANRLFAPFTAASQAPAYWQSFVRSALDSLTNDYQGEARKALLRIREFNRFPLNMDASGPSLSVEEVREAGRLISILRASQGAGGGGVSNLPEAAEILVGPLRPGAGAIGKREQDALGEIKVLVDALMPEGGDKLTFTLVPAKEIPGRAGPGVKAIILGARNYTLGRVGDADPLIGPITVEEQPAAKMAELMQTRFEMPGPGLAWKFTRADGSPAAEVVSEGPWPALRLLADNRSEPADVRDRAASKWSVCLPVALGGETYAFFLSLEASRPLPVRERWPNDRTWENLGGAAR